MYFFYVDESGDRGLSSPDPIYVLTAIGLFENRWYKFYRHITNIKRSLMVKLHKDKKVVLQLADCEIKSRWVRNPRERDKHPFLRHLSVAELNKLIGSYYSQIPYHYMTMITIIIDKSKMDLHFDAYKLHRKAWELLCERIENFMNEYHGRHNAVIICDAMGKTENISLAMKHSYFIETYTSSGLQLKHIIEMPLFVSSELSEGVQLADLCAYNFQRAFRDKNMGYSYFKMMVPHIYSSQRTELGKIDGLKIFPDSSDLVNLVKAIK
jgi:hypothetical protein